MSNPLPGSPGFPYQPPTAQKSGGMSAVKIVLIVFAVLGLGCVCCGGAIYYFFSFGMGVVANDAAAAASQNPVVRDQLGELEGGDLSINFMATAEAQQELGEDCLAFDADGPLGKGILVFRTGGRGGDSIGELIQVRIDGETIPLE
jgi:hypothetical protein